MEKLYRNSGVLNPVSDKIGQLNFDGNITPHAWYLSPRLQNEGGKPNLVAITLLADIIYWYRPTLIRDEHTGAVTGVKQKFDRDKLQKHYEKWGKTFGLTKRQVEDAMAFLKAKGLVTVETRAVETDRGVLPHCAFIEPVFEAIHAITFPSPEKTGEAKRTNARVLLPKKREASPEKTGDASRKNGGHLPKKREHTYTTAQTSSETTTENPPPPEVPPAPVQEEEEAALDVPEQETAAQKSRVEAMLDKLAAVTGTRIEIEALRPLTLECVRREHKDAWTHTMGVLKNKMACDRKPLNPNRYAATVLKTALESPAQPAAAPKTAPPAPAEPSAPAPAPAQDKIPRSGDAPAPWALKKARHELSGSDAAAFKQKHGRPSGQADWEARAREIEAEGAEQHE